MPCQAKRESAMKVLSDSTEDSEIRIAAYLVVLKCPDFNIFSAIKELLTKEEVNQGNRFYFLCFVFIFG